MPASSSHLLNDFLKHWDFVRNETYEILQSINDDQLQFIPEGEKWQPLYYQFGCIGRTQIVYTEAVKTGMMDFSLFASDSLPKKTDYQSKHDLLAFLKEKDHAWNKSIQEKNDASFVIYWPRYSQLLPIHIASLENHERLHHGQLISYFTIAGFPLPEGFKANWAL